MPSILHAVLVFPSQKGVEGLTKFQKRETRMIKSMKCFYMRKNERGNESLEKK